MYPEWHINRYLTIIVFLIYFFPVMFLVCLSGTVLNNEDNKCKDPSQPSRPLQSSEGNMQEDNKVSYTMRTEVSTKNKPTELSTQREEKGQRPREFWKGLHLVLSSTVTEILLCVRVVGGKQRRQEVTCSRSLSKLAISIILVLKTTCSETTRF